MGYFSIKMGRTHQEIQKHNFLWAPEPSYKGESGKRITQSGWKPVPEIKMGDISFLFLDGLIASIGIAQKDAYKSKRPKNRKYDKWKNKGYKVEIYLIELETPINFSSFINDFYSKFSDQSTPKLVSVSHKLTETYSNHLSENAGEFLLTKLTPKDRLAFQGALSLIVNSDFPLSAGNSWQVVDKNIAIKTADKTLIKEKSTDIPQDIISFFS
jgi:hypothetical protein